MLSGKNILITGANGVLGKSTVQVAKNYGAIVIELDISFTNKSASQFCVDLTDLTAVKNCIASQGKIDAVFNIAGGFSMGSSVAATSEEEWDNMNNINVKTMRNMVTAVLPQMIENMNGSIVNIGANAAINGKAMMGAYVAAKSTVMRLTETISQEARLFKVNVNAVLPSILDTPTNRADMPDANHDSWVSPASIAELMCFLASDRAKDIHGALIPVVGLS
jgi:NAD(P)-dependent dehydrogenase (short-subunit alcohol dehydrogenase family)